MGIIDMCQGYYSYEEFKDYIDTGCCDINELDVNGNHGIHWLASSSDEERIPKMVYMLKNGVNPDIRTQNAHLVLDYSEMQSGEDWTPLMIAAFEGFYSDVSMFIKMGATVNVSDSYGFTPLMLAVYHRFDSELKVLRLLLEGSDAHAKTRNGWGAYGYAIRHGITTGFGEISDRSQEGKDLAYAMFSNLGIEISNLQQIEADSNMEAYNNIIWPKIMCLLAGDEPTIFRES